MTLKEILKSKIYAWFRERSNRAATAKQIQKAFPDYSPDMVEKVLSGRNSKGYFDFRVYDADEGTYCLYTEDFLYPDEAETPEKEEKPEVGTKKKPTIRERIESWFRERGNEPATLKEVQAAFPDVNPKSISGTLSGKDKNGEYNFNADYSSNPMRYYMFLPLEEAVEEAVKKASCGGDCSHCRADTCYGSRAKKEEKEDVEEISPEKMLATEFFASSEKFFSPSEAESQQTVKKRIFAWFRENNNEPATLEQVQAVFSDYSPEVVRKVLNDYCKCFFEYPSTVGKYCLLQRDFLHPEVETSGEALSRIAKSLESIAKSLAKIADTEKTFAKILLEKQKEG